MLKFLKSLISRFSSADQHFISALANGHFGLAVLSKAQHLKEQHLDML